MILLFFVEYLLGWASGAFPFICFVVRFDVKDVITFGASPVAMVDAVVGRGSECDDILDIKPNNEADEWECPTCPPQ